MEKVYDIFGIENALLDVIVPIDEVHLSSFGFTKGKMHLIKKQAQELLLKSIHTQHLDRIPAGSCTNAIMAASNFGLKTAFCGKVGIDEHGKFFESELKKDGVTTFVAKDRKELTGTVVSMVTPDAERTFAVYGGAALELKKQELPVSEIAASKILHLTAYTLEDKSMRETILKAIDVARENGVRISLDLADAHLIQRIHPVLRPLVEKYVDILFVNEPEAHAFTRRENHADIVKDLERLGKITIYKLGEKGSLIIHDGQQYPIPCYKVSPIDTTGAGDLYAAGFFYGYLNNAPFLLCGQLGAFAASKIVQQRGARLTVRLKDEMEKRLIQQIQ